jgi:hypothetical protein
MQTLNATPKMSILDEAMAITANADEFAPVELAVA